MTEERQDASAQRQLTSTAREDRIRVKNRRMRWLEQHPEYLSDASREIAEPLLYDRLVRRWMSAEERETLGRQRGFAEALEASLTRSEAKIDALEHPDPDDPVVYVRGAEGAITGIEQDQASRPSDKDEAWNRWTELIADDFVSGHDRDFDYAAVDCNDDYDDRAETDRDQLEEYLNADGEQYLGESEPQGETGIQDY